MSAQSHQSDPRVRNRRTLERDHPRLPAYLRSGLDVLDAGCGTGSITAGIARAATLIRAAAAQHVDLPNLHFRQEDVLTLEGSAQFDVATAARLLQRIGPTQRAVDRLAAAIRPGGRLVVLDYNHSQNAWEPAPPAAFRRFYDAFLSWREHNGWDNGMGDHLPALFQAAGLAAVESFADDAIDERHGPEFAENTALWSRTAESLGPTIVAAGYLTDAEAAQAVTAFRDFAATRLERQTLSLRTVTAVRSSRP